MDYDARVTQCFLGIIGFSDVVQDATAAQRVHNDFVKSLDALLDPTGCDPAMLQNAYAMAYPIVALADESAMLASPELSAYWRAHTLQVKYFQEHAAGDNLFVRLGNLALHSAPLQVLSAYYTALTLGFRGRYASAQEDAIIAALIDELHAVLSRRGAFCAKPLPLVAHAHAASQAATASAHPLGMPPHHLPDASSWTTRRAWRLLGAVCIASAALWAVSLWYLRIAAAPVLQLVATAAQQ